MPEKLTPEDEQEWRMSTVFVKPLEGRTALPVRDEVRERANLLMAGVDELSKAEAAFETLHEGKHNKETPAYRAAHKLLRDILQEHPGNYFALKGLLYRAMQGNELGAISKLSKALVHHYPDDPDAYLFAATALTVSVDDRRHECAEEKFARLENAREFLEIREELLTETGEIGKDRATIMRLAEIERKKRNLQSAVDAKSTGSPRTIVHRDGVTVRVKPIVPEKNLNPVREMSGVRKRARICMRDGHFDEAKPLIETLRSTGVADHAVLVWRFKIAIYERDANTAQEMFRAISSNMPRRAAEIHRRELYALEESVGAADYNLPSRGQGSGMYAGENQLRVRRPVDRSAALQTWSPGASNKRKQEP